MDTASRSALLVAAMDRHAACPAEDVEAQDEVLREIVRLDPRQEWAWFDLGLHAKWRRDWAACRRYNEQALSTAGVLVGNPAAWNLGIAATALGDLAIARRAWSAFGVTLPTGNPPMGNDPTGSPHPGDTPGTAPDAGLGPTPVRLNPDPRFPGQSPLVIDGRFGKTEVVWCRRLCPARAVVTNVPFPESGHRFGDVVLHDGEPVGERTVDGRAYPVFDELDRLVDSSLPTLLVSVRCPLPDDAEALSTAFREAELAAEDWTASPEALCDACVGGGACREHGSAGGTSWESDRSFGLAAPEFTAAGILARWRAAGPGRGHGVPERVL